jgi:dipeptidyl aminopeptidase/acylaminoacyl peptidase
VITVHGGGWEGNYGSDADVLMSAYITSFQDWGYRVFNLAHRPNRKSVKDMLDAVVRVKDRYPKRPLCLFGGSSGGHLVLMAAIREPDLVDCVIDQGGIPDLIRPDTTPGWVDVREKAAGIWGENGLRAVSPYQHARKIEAPVLVIAPACDQITSVARQQELVDAIGRAQLLVQAAAAVPGTGIDTGHCELTYDSVVAEFDEMHAFVDRYAN